MQLAPGFTVKGKARTAAEALTLADEIEAAVGAVLTGNTKPEELDVGLLTGAVQALRDHVKPALADEGREAAVAALMKNILEHSSDDGWCHHDLDDAALRKIIGRILGAREQTPGEQVERIVHLRTDRARRIYIAGPMTGLPEFNFPLFNAVAANLRAAGWHVENPAEHGHIADAGWSDYLRWDISRIATCGSLWLLPGWSKSKGATLEVHIANTLGMQIEHGEGAEREKAQSDVSAALNGAVAGLQGALIFLDQMRAAAAGEDVTATGVARDAREWLETAARALIDVLSTPAPSEGTAAGT